jgi:hypothetical protein
VPHGYPAFDDWLDECFYYQDPERDSDADASARELPAAVTVEYLTRLFRTPLECVGRFSDRKLNDGLWYLVSADCSNHMFALVDDSVPEAEQVACIESMKHLYTELFASRCTDVTSHGQSQADEISPLNTVCYMWWDIIPIYGRPEQPSRASLDEAVLKVMEEALTLPSQACQESALHGLGHWASHYPDRVRSVVAEYLATQQVAAALREYAVAAGQGRVQ